MFLPTTLLLTLIPAVFATHLPLQCPKPRRFNGSPTCLTMAGNVSTDVFYVTTFERSPNSRHSTTDAFGRLRHALDSVRKDRRRGFGLVNVEAGGAHCEIAQIFENDKIYDISKIKDLDLILALKIAGAGLAGSASDTKKLIIVISSTDGACLNFPQCKNLVETMEKEENIYTIFVDFQSEKSASNNHIIYDTNLWPSKHMHGHLFAEYAADCVCRKLSAKDEILTSQVASGMRKKRSRMIIILTAVPILTILVLGAAAPIYFVHLRRQRAKSAAKGPATLSGTLAPVALGAKKTDDVKKTEKSIPVKKDTVNEKQAEKFETKNTAKV